ncbi:MAG: hypothetical protein KF812_07300, partial [Fimbriimonadaceae bacterium]|nr:hypothetical protein [Fimbriimonadaceae bacterium]
MIATLVVLAITQPGADLAVLTQGVTRIASPGTPGPIAAFGRDAFVVVDAKANQGRLPVVAAARFGRGKIIAFGHGGYLSAPEQGDTRRLLANAVRWTGGREAKVFAPGNQGFATALSGYGIECETTALDYGRLPTGPAVIVLDSHAVRSEQIPALRRFIESGGAWVTAGLGWGWQQVNRNQVVNLPANALLREAGIAITDGYLDPDASGLIEVKSPAPNTHAGDALMALRANSFSGAAAAVDTVRTALSALPKDHPFARQVESQVMTRAQPAIGPDKPLGRDVAADRLAVVYYEMMWPTWPAEEVGVHPSAALFPGAVPESAVRGETLVELPEGQSGFVATGMYCPPGEVVRITASGLPTDAVVRVGAHKDENWHHDRWTRFPHISYTFPFRSGRAEFAHPFGGLIYIESSRPLPEKSTLTIAGAVETPLFVL